MELLERRALLSPHAITVDVGGDTEVANHTTLRDAIALANAEPGGGDTINFDPSVTGTITLTHGELAISNPMTIAGPGAGTLTISGNNASRILVIGDSNPTKYDVTIYGLTFSQGNCLTDPVQTGLGGAIYNFENLTLHDMTFSSNTAKDGGAVFNNLVLTSNNDLFSQNSASIYGGAIYNASTLISTDDTFSANTAPNGGAVENLGTQTSTNDSFINNVTTVQGGGIDNEGTLTSSGNTFSGNSSVKQGGGGAGGGIYNFDLMVSTNDTFFSNTAMAGGGVFSVTATMTTVNDTIAGNTGRGIELQHGTWNSRNTIVAGNVLYGSTTAGEILNNAATVNASYSLVGDASSAGGITNGTNHNIVGKTVASVFVTDNSSNPLLANNGGPVETIALLAKGPAVGVGGAVATSTATIANSSSPSTITVNSSTLLVAGDLLRIDNEIFTVSSIIDATHVSVLRGQLNTSVAAHLANAPIYLAIDATVAVRVNQDLGAAAEVNHAPAGTSKTVSAFENTAYTVKTADFGFTDPNDTPANSLLAVQINSLPTEGTLTDNGTAVTVGQFVSAADITTGKLIFAPTAYVTGGTFVLCTFQVEDNGGTANGGVNLDPNSVQLGVNIAHINQAPSGSTATLTTLENTAYTFKAADFGFTDAFDAPPNNFLAVKFTTLPTVGTIADNGTALTASQLVPVSDISAGRLVFTPTSYFSGNALFLSKFQVQDDGGTANGGKNLDPNPKILNINLVHVNQSPVGTQGTVSALQDKPYALKVADFGLTDPHDTPPNSLLAVKFSTLPTAGTLADNGTAVTVGQFVSATDILHGKLIFTPNAGLNGGPYFLCRFQVEDNGGTANGGKDLDPNARLMYVSIQHVNHAPQGTSKTVAVLENGSYAVKAADFGMTDPLDSPANSLQSVKITALPATGMLVDNGTAVTVGQYVSVTDINSGKLKFQPTQYLTGGAYSLCQFQVQDNGGTANGGINLDPTAKTLSFNITPVNQAPVGTPGTVTTARNTSYTIQTSDFGFSDPHDNPPNSLLAVKFTVVPTAGTLTDNGIAVTANQLVSAADISSGKLVFTPVSNLRAGTYFLCKFQVQDNGGTANGGTNLDATPRILDITITS